MRAHQATVGLLFLPACLAAGEGDLRGGDAAADRDAGGGSALEGEVIYRTPQSPTSPFACATCHALDEPPEDGLRRPAHALRDVMRRPSFDDGAFTSPLAATNDCLAEWMGGAPPWTGSSPAWRALSVFLATRTSTRAAPALALDIVPPPADTSGGDPARGRSTSNATCRGCHGEDGLGGLGPRIKGTGLDGAYVARRVRTSGPRDSSVYRGLTGGTMPFWGGDRLTDAELLDVIAFLGTP